MAWQKSRQTFIWIFPVGRGSAGFLRTGLNQGFVLDMAGGTFEDPAEFIRKNFLDDLDPYREKQIAQAVLSHPHADHVCQCEELEKEDMTPSLLTCPNDKVDEERVDWNRIGDSDSETIKTYRSLFEERTPPLQTILYDSKHKVPDLEYGIYYVRPPECDKLHPDDDNMYGNATSIALYLRHGPHSILFPGDLTPEAMELVLDDDEQVEKRYTKFDPNAPAGWHEQTSDQPCLGDELSREGLSILVAPHHGLESCYSEKLYDTIRNGKPQLVVISERRKSQEDDGTTDSRYTNGSGGSGLTVEHDGERQEKTFLTTVNAHHILVLFSGAGKPRVYANKDPNKLLKVLNDL